MILTTPAHFGATQWSMNANRTMASDDPELEKLDALLQQCLGHIDEQANRLQDEQQGFDYGELDRLDTATSDLHNLVHLSLIHI